MKQVTYAGTTFITGTDIADSLIALATTLGRTGGAAAVRVPAIDEHHEIRSLDIVFGSSNCLVAVELFPTLDELIDVDCVKQLDDQSRAISAPRGVLAAEAPSDDWADPDLDGLFEER